MCELNKWDLQTPLSCVLGLILVGCSPKTFTLNQVQAPNESVSEQTAPQITPGTPQPVPQPMPQPEVTKGLCEDTAFVGAGTEANPYQIDDPCDFRLVDKAPKAFWKVVQDIDFNKYQKDGSFFSVKHFDGHFDGGFYSIKNFKTDCELNECNESPIKDSEKTKHRGLFQYVLDANFKNVVLKDFSVHGINDSKRIGTFSVGGLVGHSYRSQFSKISGQGKIRLTGHVNFNGPFGVGAIVGNLQESHLDQVSAKLELTGEGTPYGTGSVAGYMCSSQISNSHGESSLSNNLMVGGLASVCDNGGLNVGANNIKDSFFVGEVNFRLSTTKGNENIWSPCLYVSGLGDASRTLRLENSFWVGSSNCDSAETNLLTLSDAYLKGQTFDQTIWKTSANALPKLKWQEGL